MPTCAAKSVPGLKEVPSRSLENRHIPQRRGPFDIPAQQNAVGFQAELQAQAAAVCADVAQDSSGMRLAT